MLAPPWIPVPPAGYGGIEQVIALLCDELVRRGHFVTLFAAPGSHSKATVRPVLTTPHECSIGMALYEADHVAHAFADVDAARENGRAFDVIHDHSGFTALAMADRIDTPLVHTLHGPFTDDTSAFYAAHGHRAAIVAISRTQLERAPAALQGTPVIPNPIDVNQWPFCPDKDDYLLWIGRMDEVKGPHRAIEVAHRAGRPLVIAGPVQPGQEAFFDREVRPCVDGRRVRYVGEVGGRRRIDLFARASALLMPIAWDEPFGMVMIEALVCGTPVIGFPRGAATEIILDGANGFQVSDEAEMAAAVRALGDIDPRRCRASVASRYDVAVVTDAYEQVYRGPGSTHAPRKPSIASTAALTAAAAEPTPPPPDAARLASRARG